MACLPENRGAGATNREVDEMTGAGHGTRARVRCNAGSGPRARRGAVLPMVALALAVLLGFAGLVIDLGGMFVAKTELQSALDSCSLSAAAELDGATDALTRATSAGKTAGNANKLRYQKAAAGIADADIVFSDTLSGSYSHAFAPVANARYAKCTLTTPGVLNNFIQLVGAPATNAVNAVAVATRAHAQSACPVPIGLRARTGTAPNYGYTAGEWVTMLYDPSKTSSSEMGWYNLDGSNSASETKSEMSGTGYCGSRVGDSVGTPGAQVSVDDAWNARFGIYKNKGDPSQAALRPDFTGYVYTGSNWKNASPQNAYSGVKKAGSDATAANFLAKRAAFASYDDTGTDVKDGDKISGLNMKGGYKDLASPGVGGEHQAWGQSRRIVLTPVISAGKIADFACMLMLQPISGPTVTIQLEYLGNAGSVSSPCTASGLPGGSAGPLVPALVR
jgi:Flp pilus assembly protein TadG